MESGECHSKTHALGQTKLRVSVCERESVRERETERKRDRERERERKIEIDREGRERERCSVRDVLSGKLIRRTSIAIVALVLTKKKPVRS